MCIAFIIIIPRPARDHYIADLHHLKYELEEGTTLDGRPVRFGYNPLEFENFSWRGYAQMSSIQVGLGPPSHTMGGTLQATSQIIDFLQAKHFQKGKKGRRVINRSLRVTDHTLDSLLPGTYAEVGSCPFSKPAMGSRHK